MIVLYPLSSVVYSTANYFKNRNYRNLIIEYEYIKKIIYVLFPFFVLYIISVLLGQPRFPFPYPVDNSNEAANNIRLIADAFLYFKIAALFAVTSALLKIILLLAKKNFQFYFAKACFNLSSEKQYNKVDKMRYFLRGLYFYNKYLNRNLGLQISRLEDICYNIMIKSEDDNREINSVCQAFESSDKLHPIKHFSRYQKENSEPFLIKDSPGERIQQWITILGTLVSILSGILGIIILIPSFPK
jgi:hypothetical protein